MNIAAVIGRPVAYPLSRIILKNNRIANHRLRATWNKSNSLKTKNAPEKSGAFSISRPSSTIENQLNLKVPRVNFHIDWVKKRRI
jgi:hypothetical protein